MTGRPIEHLRTEFRKMKDSIGHAFREDANEPGGGAGRAQSRAQRHRVPARLSILDVMEGNLATVSPHTGVHAAVSLMIEHRISSVPVVDADGRIVGALNEKDLMKVFYQIDAGSVGAVMTVEPFSVSIDAPLVDVVDALMASDFRRVLIHENERLVGVITRSHLMPALMQALEARAGEGEAALAPH